MDFVEYITAILGTIGIVIYNMINKVPIFKDDSSEINFNIILGLSLTEKSIIILKKSIATFEEHRIFIFGLFCSLYLLLRPLGNIYKSGKGGFIDQISANYSLIISSLFCSYLLAKSLYRLYTFPEKSELAYKSQKVRDTFIILKYTADQYLIYGIIISYFWVITQTSANSSVYSIILLFTLLTIDDWNIISKYAEDIPLAKIRKSDIVKLFLFSTFSISLILFDCFNIFGILPERYGITYIGLILLILITYIILTKQQKDLYLIAEKW